MRSLGNLRTLDEEGVRGGVGDRVWGVGEGVGWSISRVTGPSIARSTCIFLLSHLLKKEKKKTSLNSLPGGPDAH